MWSAAAAPAEGAAIMGVIKLKYRIIINVMTHFYIPPFWIMSLAGND